MGADARCLQLLEEWTNSDGELVCAQDDLTAAKDHLNKVTVGCKRAVRNQDFGFHFTFRPQVFFRPQILALSPLKESQQRRNQDHSKALALKIEIDMPYALVEPREAYPRGK